MWCGKAEARRLGWEIDRRVAERVAEHVAEHVAAHVARPVARPVAGPSHGRCRFICQLALDAGTPVISPSGARGLTSYAVDST
jgi:hypothetical protein